MKHKKHLLVPGAFLFSCIAGSYILSSLDQPYWILPYILCNAIVYSVWEQKQGRPFCFGDYRHSQSDRRDCYSCPHLSSCIEVDE